MTIKKAQQIIQQATAALIPYARNSRTHSDQQVSQIAASIREFGFTSPVLVDDDNGIVAGQGRVMAAQQIGLTEVPTINVGWLTEAQRRAYVIADNQLALNAGWDESLLAQEVAWLNDQNFATDVLGFDADELSALLGSDEDSAEGGASGDEKIKGNLSDRFMIPPFSVLNAREGWWQNRKRAWLALGIKSELGRGGGLLKMSESNEEYMYNKTAYIAQRQAAAPGQRATTAKSSAATAQGGR